MTTLALKGNWNIVKGRLKQKWAKLTDDDLQFVEGKEDELMGRIQKRSGEAQEHTEQEHTEPPAADACDCCHSDKHYTR